MRPSSARHTKPIDFLLGTATGILPLQVFLKEYSARFYTPGFSDFTVLVQTGNTDGWSRVVYSLLNEGDSVLVEVNTYICPHLRSF